MGTTQSNNLAQTPDNTPIADKDTGRVNFIWNQWFTNVQIKLNTITAAIIALSKNATAGFLSSDGIGGIFSRTLTAGTGITITNPTGVGGNPVISASASGGAPINIVNNTAISYTVQATDLPSTSSNVGWVASNVASTNLIKIDNHTNQPIPVGGHLYVSEEGAGNTIIQGLTGATLVGASITPVSKGVGEAVQIATNIWHIFGNLAYANASAYDAAVLSDTPLAYWKLAETTGTTAADSSGNSYNASYVASPTLASALIASHLNTSCGLNGTSQYGTIIPPSPLQLGATGSFECWVYPTATPNGGRVFSAGYNGSTSIPWCLGFSTSGTLGAATGAYPFFGSYASGWGGVTTTTALVSSTPYHMVGTVAAGVMTLYINGTSVGQVTGISAPSTNAIGLAFGAVLTNTTPSNFFQGNISNCAIYGTALSAARVLAHYNAGI